MKSRIDRRVSEINAFFPKERVKVETVVSEVVLERRKCTRCGFEWAKDKRIKDFQCPACGCGSWQKPRPVYHCKGCGYEWKPRIKPHKCPDCKGKAIYPRTETAQNTENTEN